MTSPHTTDGALFFLELGSVSFFTSSTFLFFGLEGPGWSSFFGFGVAVLAPGVPRLFSPELSFSEGVTCQHMWLHPHQCITAA